MKQRSYSGTLTPPGEKSKVCPFGFDALGPQKKHVKLLWDAFFAVEI